MYRTLVLSVLFVQICVAQQKVLVDGSGRVYHLQKGQSASQVLNNSRNVVTPSSLTDCSNPIEHQYSFIRSEVFFKLLLKKRKEK